MNLKCCYNMMSHSYTFTLLHTFIHFNHPASIAATSCYALCLIHVIHFATYSRRIHIWHPRGYPGTNGTTFAMQFTMQTRPFKRVYISGFFELAINRK